MNYSIRTIEQQFVTVNGINGPETFKAPDGWIPPQSYIQKLYEADNKQLWQDVDGKATSLEIFAAFPGLREWKAQQIRGEGNTRLEAIAKPYGPAERESWFIQVSEAEQWLINQATATPMLTAMAAARQISLAEMVNKVMENNGIFRTYCGTVLGIQQALLDQVYTEQDFEAFMGITWPA